MATRFKTEFTSEEERYQYWMSKTPQERAEGAAQMYREWRKKLEAALPEGLSEQERTKRIYYVMYGEELPGDFFKNKLKK